MTVTAAEKKAIQADQTKWLKGKQAEHSTENERIYNEYLRLIAVTGATEEGVYAELCERFSCTPRRINNVRTKRSGARTIATQMASEATLLMTVEKMVMEHEAMKMAYEQELNKVEIAAQAGIDWVSIEQTEVDGGRTVKTTKRIPASHYALELQEKITMLPERTLTAMSRLLTKNIININTGGDLAQRSIADLDAEEKAIKEKLQIKGEEVEA